MKIEFNYQLRLIDNTKAGSVSSMVQALRGEEVGLGQLLLNRLGGEYTLPKLEEAYEQFFRERSVDIADLRSSDPEAYEQLVRMLSIRAISITEAIEDKGGVYRRVMHQITENMG